jgi:hypothetical protein
MLTHAIISVYIRQSISVNQLADVNEAQNIGEWPANVGVGAEGLAQGYTKGGL